MTHLPPLHKQQLVFADRGSHFSQKRDSCSLNGRKVPPSVGVEEKARHDEIARNS